MSLGATIAVVSAIASGVMIVMLFLLPETRGRSLEGLDAGAPGATAVPRMMLEPGPTTAE